MKRTLSLLLALALLSGLLSSCGDGRGESLAVSPAPSVSELPSLVPPSEPPVETPSESPVDTPSESPVESAPSETPTAVYYPGRVPFTPPNKDDMSIYDTSAIRDAWAAGDPSGLSDYDRAIYDAAQAVLTQCVWVGMSDYEKEYALYQWIVQYVKYDWTHNDVMVPTPRKSFTPYGALVDRVGVCLGYATAFQLLMDLAGVECITVAGAGSNSTEDHAWNMVRLNGNWYCVDVTWDASRRQNGVTQGWPSQWRYFNVTSDYMAAEHQWDYVNTPEAVTGGNGK